MSFIEWQLITALESLKIALWSCHASCEINFGLNTSASLLQRSLIGRHWPFSRTKGAKIFSRTNSIPVITVLECDPRSPPNF